MPDINMHNRPNRSYHLEPYNPAWAKQFNSLKAELTHILVPEIIRIEHMGSTAVPGMVAKPQIDIFIEVKSLTPIPQYYDAMRQSGYTPMGDYTLLGEEFFYKQSPDGARLASVHIWPTGHEEIQFQIDFREYLKTHPDEIKGYSRLKQDLFAKYPDDYNAYGREKRPYINELRKRVETWRQTARALSSN